MSIENTKTLNVYKEKGGIYLNNNVAYELQNKEEINSRRKFVESLIINEFSTIPKNGAVFEIGSGDGRNAKFIESLGYNVTASDTVDVFLKYLSKQDLKTIKFNLLEDAFDKKYDAFLCWRVFIHFTMDDLEKSLNKIYDYLNPDGVLLFNLFNIINSDTNGKWIDFNGPYRIGAERYYSYYSKEEIDKIVCKIGYEIKNFCYECPNDKYLVYSLQKKK